MPRKRKGPGEHDYPTRPSPRSVLLRAALTPVAADLATRVAEFALHLGAQEHHRGDDRERDERDEQDVLHHARSTLIVGELGLEPGTEDEQIHGRAPSGRR